MARTSSFRTEFGYYSNRRFSRVSSFDRGNADVATLSMGSRGRLNVYVIEYEIERHLFQQFILVIAQDADHPSALFLVAVPRTGSDLDSIESDELNLAVPSFPSAYSIMTFSSPTMTDDVRFVIASGAAGVDALKGPIWQSSASVNAPIHPIQSAKMRGCVQPRPRCKGCLGDTTHVYRSLRNRP
jgi:hypothetical protein